MYKKLAEGLGATLIAGGVLVTGWLAFRDGPPHPTPGEVVETWVVDPDLRAELLARLPPVFEIRANEVRDFVDGRVVPLLSAFDVQLLPVVTRGGPQVLVIGLCDPVRAAGPLSRPVGDGSALPDPPHPQVCSFDGGYDPHHHRFVMLSFQLQELLHKSDPLSECNHGDFQAVTHLADLPPDILASLEGKGALADNGEALQAGDAIRMPGPSTRRFALAEIDPDRAIVAVEEGGNYHVDVWLFQRSDGHWWGEPHWHGSGRPNSGQDLLSQVCRDVASPPMRNLDAANRIIVEKQANGSLELFVMDPNANAAPEFVRVDLAGNVTGSVDLATAESRQAFQVHLMELRAEVLPDQPVYASLTRFMEALARAPVPAKV